MKKLKSFQLLLSTLLLTILFLPWTAQATTYYSLVDGSWRNTTTVWSTNGITPCGCNPNATVNGFDVVVRHKITHNNNLIIESGSNVRVESLGVLTLDTDELVVRGGGTLLNLGTINVKELEISPNGTLTSNGPMVILSDHIDIQGILNLNEVLINRIGNLEVGPTGQIFMGSISAISLLNGDVENQGLIFFNVTSCSKISGGDFYNESPGGSVIGLGAVLSSGFIDNDGFWDPNTAWCASQGSRGTSAVPLEDCPTANQGCSVILPVNLTDFTGSITENHVVELRWETHSESNLDCFALSRSLDGIDFFPLNGSVRARNQAGISTYSFTDLHPVAGSIFYRISVKDQNGAISENLATVEIFAPQSADKMSESFPNPFQDQLQIVLDDAIFEDQLEASFLDLTGRVIQTHSLDLLSGNRVSLDTETLIPGFYLLRLTSGPHTEVLRVSKN